MIFSYKLFQLKKRGSINKSPRNFQIKIAKRDVSSAKLFLDSLGMMNIVFLRYLSMRWSVFFLLKEIKEKSIKKDKAILVSTAKTSLYFFNFNVYTSFEVENE